MDLNPPLELLSAGDPLSARIQGISPPPMGELRELYTLSLLSWSPSADKTPTGTPVPALRIMKSFKGSNVELKLLKLS